MMGVESVTTDPLVSIIMPAYNAEKYIAESIQSALAQTYKRWELLIVDDGSEDGTATIGRKFASADARIKYLRRPNGGQGKARNTGLEKATGELVAFLDADDLWVPEKLALQVTAIRETESDLVFSDGVVFDEHSEPPTTIPFRTIRGRFAGSEMFKLLLIENRLPILSVLVRRAALNAVNFFDEDRRYQNCEDYELWLKLAQYGAVFYGMDANLVRYRRHPNSMTASQINATAPMIAVLEKYRHVDSLSQLPVEKRLRGMYRTVVAAMIEENRINEARIYLNDLAAWDRLATTSLQKIFISLWPRRYNFLSYQLYRIEWRLRKVSRRTDG